LPAQVNGSTPSVLQRNKSHDNIRDHVCAKGAYTKVLIALFMRSTPHKISPHGSTNPKTQRATKGRPCARVIAWSQRCTVHAVAECTGHAGLSRGSRKTELYYCTKRAPDISWMCDSNLNARTPHRDEAGKESRYFTQECSAGCARCYMLHLTT